jgi:hypothetical protein
MNIVVPTGTVDGDLLVWICGDTASAGIISNTPSGWVAPPGSKGTSGGGAALAVYTRIASGDAGATYTGSGTIYPAFIIVTVRGVGPTGSASFDGIAFATDNSNIIYTPALSGLSPQLI